MMRHWAFHSYVLVAAITTFVMICLDCRDVTMGEKHILYYILVCSLVGSVLVISIKGLGVAIMVTLQGQQNQFALVEGRQ